MTTATPRVFRLAAAAIVTAALSAAAQAASAPWKAVPASGAQPEYSMISGRSSAASRTRTAVARDVKTWKRIWSRSCGASCGALPDVDFSREIVVAVFLGEESGAASARIDLIEDPENSSHLWVLYGGEKSAGAAPGRPFVVARVSNSYASVSFAPDNKCRALACPKKSGALFGRRKIARIFSGISAAPAPQLFDGSRGR